MLATVHFHNSILLSFRVLVEKFVFGSDGYAMPAAGREELYE
jgi:hypothetical protein